MSTNKSNETGKITLEQMEKALNRSKTEIAKVAKEAAEEATKDITAPADDTCPDTDFDEMLNRVFGPETSNGDETGEGGSGETGDGE